MANNSSNNWLKVWFPTKFDYNIPDQEVGILAVVRNAYRNALLMVLGVVTIASIYLSYANFVVGKKPFVGWVMVITALVIGYLTTKVYLKQGRELLPRIIVCLFIVAATSFGALQNGLFPLALSGGCMVLFYLLLPGGLAMVSSIALLVCNLFAVGFYPLPLDQGILQRNILQAFIIIPSLHFLVCTSHWLIQFYSSVLQSRTRMISSISHELRSPLNGMTGLVHLTSQLSQTLTGPAGEEIRENLKRLSELQEHMNGVIGNTLDISSLQAGKLLIREEVVDLRALAISAAAAFRVTVAEKGLDLDCSFSTKSKTALVLSDQLRLRQMLFNLLSNAIKYTEAGRIKVEIELFKNQRSDWTVRLSVQDTGIGIPAAKQHLVFERFTQVHGEEKYVATGSGLGLSLVKELAQAMGGFASFSSREGVGSHFWVEVPVPLALESSKKAEPDYEVSNHTPGSSGSNLAGLRVLVVDDETINRKVISEVLKNREALVEMAVTGQQAIDKVKSTSQPFDLIIMDFQMPVMTGLEAIRLIRALPGYAKTPALCLTGNAENKDVSGLIDRNDFHEVLSKPIQPDDLIAKVVYYCLVNKIA